MRTVLAVQFNAFSTGLYHFQSMINHNCSPNCTKSTPTGRTVSQIVSCRDITKGEEITIHYGGYVERSWRYRQRFLDQQHFFQLSPSPFPEAIDGVLNNDQNICLDDIELRMDDLELDLATVLDCLRIGLKKLPEQHLAVTRAHILVLQEQLKLLEETGDPNTALEALRTCLEIRKRQKVYLGPDHLDIAASAEDMEELLSFLLSSAPKLLFASIPEFPNFSVSSKAEYQAKKEKERIRKLYQH